MDGHRKEGKGKFLRRSQSIFYCSVPLKSGRVGAGGNTEELQTPVWVRNAGLAALGSMLQREENGGRENSWLL